MKPYQYQTNSLLMRSWYFYDIIPSVPVTVALSQTQSVYVTQAASYVTEWFQSWFCTRMLIRFKSLTEWWVSCHCLLKYGLIEFPTLFYWIPSSQFQWWAILISYTKHANVIRHNFLDLPTRSHRPQSNFLNSKYTYNAYIFTNGDNTWDYRFIMFI